MTTESMKAAAAIDEGRLWERLMAMAAIGATPRGGVNRQALSAEDAAARRLLAGWALELGFEVFQDAIANLYVRREGTEPDAAPVLAGSHLDSQPTGGRFDGALGVLAAFEALEAIQRAGIATRRSIEVVAWTNEEGSRFQPGCMGSGVFAGTRNFDALLEATDSHGTVMADALRETLDGLPDVPLRAVGFPVAAYLEAHIEQGPILENTGNTIGIVGGIQAMRDFAVTVAGEEAHAGTTPHGLRKDALKAAAEMIGALEDLMADATDTVRFTVGRFEVSPNAPNTVPGRVFFTIDFRHPEEAIIHALGNRVEAVCRAHARGCAVHVTTTSDDPPVLFDGPVMDSIRRQADALGIGHMELVSGAGHDAGNIARVCPAGMLFVPCARGISHNEAESAEPADVAAGARVLAASLVELAN